MAGPICWRPQPGRQKAYIDCGVYETFFGGARGGSKTDSALGKQGLKACKYGPHYNGLFFRREMPNLDDAIQRSKEIYGPMGGEWVDQKKTWWIPGAGGMGRLRFRPLFRVEDASKYQGQNVSDVVVEEAGEYPDPAPIMRLHGLLRSAHGVPTQMTLTGNPGGAGHHWLKERYIDAGPPMVPIIETFRWEEHSFTRARVFIPSKVTDNRILMVRDPNYIANLHLVGSTALVRAWLEGDWDAVQGAFFGEFTRSTHVYPSHCFTPPEHWARIRAMDWGSAKPFAVVWFAVSDGSDLRFPRGCLVAYRELYGVKEKSGSGFEPNVGIKKDAEAVAEMIVDAERDDFVDKAVLDPSAFAESGGPSIAERINRCLARARGGRDRKHAVFWPADNARVAKHGAMGGWDQVRARLVGSGEGAMLMFSDACRHSIRTLPMAQHDPLRAEDIDTESEDHLLDTIRYGCMARPYVRDLPKLPAKPDRVRGSGRGMTVWAPGVPKNGEQGAEW